MASGRRVGQRPDCHTFLCKFWHFQMAVSQWKLAWLTPNLGFLWISLCSFWLCESIVANPIIYRLVPRPSRFETRQWPSRILVGPLSYGRLVVSKVMYYVLLCVTRVLPYCKAQHVEMIMWINDKEHLSRFSYNLVPRVAHLTSPWGVPRGDKMRDPRWEWGCYSCCELCVFALAFPSAGDSHIRG